jgi:3(or 17)beta-hydroxysteroid dehydrogenase
MMGRLNDKVVLVTGGASGLGKAIAQRLASEGARVVISDIQFELGTRAASECGFTFLEQDVTDETRWVQVVQEIERHFGQLNILINNAGILGSTKANTPENSRLQDWKKVFAVHVEGVFLGCRAAIPAMRRSGGGSIVNMSSIAALRATAHNTAYGAAKAAVRQLTKSVAQYCAQEKLNIRCNSVHPGFVRTPLWDDGARQIARERGVSVEDIVAGALASVPLGDFTRAEDIAAAVAFLVSDDARHVTGAKLTVDGGIVHCDTYRKSVSDSPAPCGQADRSTRQ